MKRGRTENIQNAVAQYLKRRQYVDMEGSLKGAKLSQSAEEMAANLMGNLMLCNVYCLCDQVKYKWAKLLEQLLFLGGGKERASFYGHIFFTTPLINA